LYTDKIKISVKGSLGSTLPRGGIKKWIKKGIEK
jgi:hypothetical protein